MSTLNQKLRELAACSIEAGGLKPDARVVLIEQIELTIQANESSDGEVSGEPADVATVGVAAIETKGMADTFDPSKGRELSRDDAKAVPDDILAQLDTLIIRHGNARYDAWKRLGFEAHGEPENLSADIYADLYAKIASMLAAAPTAQAVPEGIARIAAERVRQIENEGFTPTLDRRNYSARQPSQIILAAIAYLSHAGYSPDFREAVRRRGGMFLWPWDASWWKPGKDDSNASRVRELEKAGALIAAEIDRLLAEEPKK